MQRQVLMLKSYLASLDDEMKRKTDEREQACKNGWYEKAARLDNQLQGLQRARDFATSGDHTINVESEICAE